MTVDWVVLTAAVIGLSLAVIPLIKSALTDPATGIGVFISSVKIEE